MNGSDPVTPSNINPENPPWGVLSAIVTWLSSIALLFLAPNVLVIPYLYLHYRGLPMPTEKVLFADKTFVLLFVSGWLPAHLLTLALIWAVATRLGKLPAREVLGLTWPPSFGVWKSIGLAISLYLAATFVTASFGGQPTELDRFLTSSRATALLLAFVAVATAPLVEELIYRGLLYSALQRAIGRWLAVVVVSSMFAGLHVWQYRQNLGVIISITLLSVVLTMIRARTGRLLPCFVVHLVFNGIQSLIIVLEPYLRALVEHWHPQPTPGVLIHILRFLG
ncbi:MAG: protease family protein [Blastocatellia bacterium]|jgi:membrane protease YdiL (CAAX protease family)|nr:protease family protein [Blastocatellia bacterium]